jgi:hypothetical protein
VLVSEKLFTRIMGPGINMKTLDNVGDPPALGSLELSSPIASGNWTVSLSAFTILEMRGRSPYSIRANAGPGEATTPQHGNNITANVRGRNYPPVELQEMEG